MIIEPVPTTPRGPRAGLGRLLGFLAPVVLLVGVVGAGLAGRTTDGAEPPLPTPAPTIGAAPSPAPTQTVVRPGDPVPGEAVVFPDQLDGIPVRTPTDAGAFRPPPPVPAAPGDLMLVAGYLSVDAVPEGCIDRLVSRSGSLCERQGVLAESPAPRRTGAGSQHGPHVHPYFPPGVRWPAGVALQDDDGNVIPYPMIVLGRYGDPRTPACPALSSRCEEQFFVERVVWAANEPFSRSTSVDPSIEINLTDDAWRDRRNEARRQLTGVSLITVTSLVRPGRVATLDPEAAQALERTGDGEPLPEAVWYVRGLLLTTDGAGGLTGVTHWVIVDDATNAVLTRSAASAVPEAQAE